MLKSVPLLLLAGSIYSRKTVRIRQCWIMPNSVVVSPLRPDRVLFLWLALFSSNLNTPPPSRFCPSKGHSTRPNVDRTIIQRRLVETRVRS